MHVDPRWSAPAVFLVAVTIVGVGLTGTGPDDPGVPETTTSTTTTGATQPSKSFTIKCDDIREDPLIRFRGAPTGSVMQEQEMLLRFRVELPDEEVQETGLVADNDAFSACASTATACAFEAAREEDAGSFAYLGRMKFDNEQDIWYRAYAILGDGTMIVSKPRVVHVDQHTNWTGTLEPCIP